MIMYVILSIIMDLVLKVFNRESPDFTSWYCLISIEPGIQTQVKIFRIYNL